MTLSVIYNVEVERNVLKFNLKDGFSMSGKKFS